MSYAEQEFEKIRCEVLRKAASLYEAEKISRISCKICCEEWLCIDCDKCKVDATYELVAAHLATSEDDRR